LSPGVTEDELLWALNTPAGKYLRVYSTPAETILRSHLYAGRVETAVTLAAVLLQPRFVFEAESTDFEAESTYSYQFEYEELFAAYGVSLRDLSQSGFVISMHQAHYATALTWLSLVEWDSVDSMLDDFMARVPVRKVEEFLDSPTFRARLVARMADTTDSTWAALSMLLTMPFHGTFGDLFASAESLQNKKGCT
jgi:hypothetical protein